MLDVVPVLLIAAALAAALWLLQRRLFGSSGSRPRAALRLTAVVLVALALVGYGAFRLSKARGIQLAGELVTRVDTGDKVVALTFDDGPQPAYTQSVVDTLEAHDAKGTFFVIGHDAAAAPDSCARSWPPGRKSATTPGRTPGCWRCPKGRSAARSSGPTH